MSGLSTASFVDGAMRGFQFGENIKDQRQMRGLREADAQRREAEFGMRQESHADSLKNSEQLRELRETQEGRAGRAESRAQASHESSMATQEQNRKVGKQQQEINRLKLQDIKGDMEEKVHRARALKMRAMQKAGFEVDQESAELFDQISNRADPEYLLSEPVVKAVDTAKAVFGGQINPNSPEALEALGLIFDEIGRGATEGRQVKPNRIVPTEDGEGFYIGLDVVGADGKKSSGVVTKNRSADPKDPVRKVTFDEIMPIVMAMDEEQQRLQDPRYVQAYMERYAPVDPTSVAGGKAPADYQLAKLIQAEFAQEGQNLSFDEAWSKVKLAASDPARYVQEYVSDRMEEQQFGDSKATPQQLEKEAIESYNRIRSMVQGQGSGGGQGGAANPPAAAIPEETLSAIAKANPGKSPEWVKAYAEHLQKQGNP